MRLGSIRYLGLGSSQLVARAGPETQLGTRESAQYSRAQLRAQLEIGPGLGDRDSNWLGLGLSSAHLPRLGAWDRARARIGLEAQSDSRLRARLRIRSTWIGARLGSFRFGKYKRSKA